MLRKLASDYQIQEGTKKLHQAFGVHVEFSPEARASLCYAGELKPDREVHRLTGHNELEAPWPFIQGICESYVARDLMVRIPDDEFDAIMRKQNVRPMDFTGRPLRGFVYVSPPGFRTAAALRTWLSRGERVAEEKAKGPTKRRPSPKTASGAGRDRALP